MKSLDFNIIPNISLGDMENIMDIEAELDSYLEEEKIENDIIETLNDKFKLIEPETEADSLFESIENIDDENDLEDDESNLEDDESNLEDDESELEDVKDTDNNSSDMMFDLDEEDDNEGFSFDEESDLEDEEVNLEDDTELVNNDEKFRFEEDDYEEFDFDEDEESDLKNDINLESDSVKSNKNIDDKKNDLDYELELLEQVKLAQLRKIKQSRTSHQETTYQEDRELETKSRIDIIREKESIRNKKIEMLLNKKKESKNRSKNSTENGKNDYEKYNNLDIESLYAEVKSYLRLNNIDKKIVDVKILEDKFGTANIKKLILKSYLISVRKGVTIGK